MVSNLSPSDLNVIQRKGYKFEGILGEGAYAKVYSVACNRPDRTQLRLACKYINQTQVPPEFVRKFLPRELNILLKLKHPNIIHVHSIFINNNKCFILMRLAEAGDALSYLLKFGGLPEKHARLWFHQLAQAIRYLHVMGIVHRDIKLENVFLSVNMNVKLGDFGFAKYTFSESGDMMLSETFCGSQQYAAPEVIKGIAYNPKLADVWSLGCVLFAMLNKKLPFDNTDAARLYELQTTHRYKYRDTVIVAVSVAVKNLIFHMLEPNVNHRYDIEAVVMSDWLRDVPLTEAQKIAFETAQAEKKRRKSFTDITVSTLQKGEVKHLIVIKEESAEYFKSQMCTNPDSIKEPDQLDDYKKKKNSPSVDTRRDIHNSNSERGTTRPFKYDDVKR